MTSYNAEEQRGAEARVVERLFPEFLHNLFNAIPISPTVPVTPPFGLPIGPLMQQREETAGYGYLGMATPGTGATVVPPDRGFLDVFSAALPILQTIAKPLVEQLLSFGPPKSDVDRQEQDRFLQFLAPLIGQLAPIAIQAAPGIISSLFGGPRSDQPIPITDRELNQRFLGPITHALVATMGPALSDLLAIVHGERRAAVQYDRMPGRTGVQLIKLSMAELTNAHRLRDGDVVQLQTTAAPTGTTEIRLTAPAHSLRWHAIQAFDGTAKPVAHVETGGADHAAFDSDAMQANSCFVFWKQNYQGVKVPVYLVSGQDMTADAKCFNFHWAAD